MRRLHAPLLLLSLAACGRPDLPAEPDPVASAPEREAADAAGIELLTDRVRFEPDPVYVGYPANAAFRVRNSGTSAVTVRATIDPPFEITPDEADLPPGREVRFRMRFVPEDAGRFEGRLAILHRSEVVGSFPFAVDAVAAPPCEPIDGCNTARFDEIEGACLQEPVAEGLPCTDACGEAGSCTAGRCVASGAACDDGNPCTLDTCTEDGCAHDGDPAAACGVPSDPCLVPVCDPVAGCSTVPAADGAACGPPGCLVASVCRQGQCVEEPIDGESCGGICPGGVCSTGACEEPVTLDDAWHRASARRPFFDDRSDGLVVMGPLARASRDGTFEEIPGGTEFQWSRSLTALYGVTGGRWFWKLAEAPPMFAGAIRALSLEEGRASWVLDDEDLPGEGGMSLVGLRDDGGLFWQKGSTLFGLSDEAAIEWSFEPCDGAGAFGSAVDEEDAALLLTRCGDEPQRLLRVTADGAVLQAGWSPAALGLACTGIQATFAGRFVSHCRPLEGGPEERTLIDPAEGTSLPLVGGWLQALTADRALLLGPDGVLRTWDLPGGTEGWSVQLDASMIRCHRPPCTVMGWDWARPTTAGTVLVRAWGLGDVGGVLRWVVELEDGGVVKRSCPLANSPYSVGWAGLHRGQWFETGDDGYGLTAFDYPGDPQLAPGWIGPDGGPAGGYRPWSP